MKKTKFLVILTFLLSPSIVFAQPKSRTPIHPAKNVQLVWCDSHVCKEKSHLVGKASFYGKHYWQGRRMANGQPFDYRKKTVALWFLPLGTMVRITNLSNGLSVVAEVTDRGPAHTLHRIADLSQAAAEALDFLQEGVATVLIQPVIEVETVPTEIVMTLAEPEIPVEKKEIASIITP